jgi:hypothetical protein
LIIPQNNVKRLNAPENTNFNDFCSINKESKKKVKKKSMLGTNDWSF